VCAHARLPLRARVHAVYDMKETRGRGQSYPTNTLPSTQPHHRINAPLLGVGSHQQSAESSHGSATTKRNGHVNLCQLHHLLCGLCGGCAKACGSGEACCRHHLRPHSAAALPLLSLATHDTNTAAVGGASNAARGRGGASLQLHLVQDGVDLCGSMDEQVECQTLVELNCSMRPVLKVFGGLQLCVEATRVFSQAKGSQGLKHAHWQGLGVQEPYHLNQKPAAGSESSDRLVLKRTALAVRCAASWGRPLYARTLSRSKNSEPGRRKAQKEASKRQLGGSESITAC